MSEKLYVTHEIAPFTVVVRRFVGSDGLPTCNRPGPSPKPPPTSAPPLDTVYLAERVNCRFYMVDLYTGAPMCGAAHTSGDYYAGERMLSQRPGTLYLTPGDTCPVWDAESISNGVEVAFT